MQLYFLASSQHSIAQPYTLAPHWDITDRRVNRAKLGARLPVDRILCKTTLQ